MTGVPEILVVCTHNAGRSVAARVLLDHHGQGPCPVHPGKRYLDWELTDPAGKPVDEVRPIVDEIERRARDLLHELGIETPSAAELRGDQPQKM